MGLFEKLEKLINEHGSANIQEKHIAFIRDELAILKEKFTMITQENSLLKTENQKLTTERDILRQKTKEYEDGISFPSDMVIPIDGKNSQQR